MARVGRGNEYSWIAQQAIGRRVGDRSLHSVQENTSGFNRSLFQQFENNLQTQLYRLIGLVLAQPATRADNNSELATAPLPSLLYTLADCNPAFSWCWVYIARLGRRACFNNTDTQYLYAL